MFNNGYRFHVCNANCHGRPSVEEQELARIQAAQRVLIKRRLRRAGILVPEDARFNLGFLRLLASLHEGEGE